MVSKLFVLLLTVEWKLTFAVNEILFQIVNLLNGFSWLLLCYAGLLGVFLVDHGWMDQGLYVIWMDLVNWLYGIKCKMFWNWVNWCNLNDVLWLRGNELKYDGYVNIDVWFKWLCSCGNFGICIVILLIIMNLYLNVELCNMMNLELWFNEFEWFKKMENECLKIGICMMWINALGMEFG